MRTDDVIFAATAITRGNLLNPIQYFPGGARTHTIVMRSKTGTVRFLDTIHRDEKLTTLKSSLISLLSVNSLCRPLRLD